MTAQYRGILGFHGSFHDPPLLQPPMRTYHWLGNFAGEFDFFGVHFFDIVFFSFVEGLQALGGISSPVKFHVECSQNHVWGPLGAQDMTILWDLS